MAFHCGVFRWLAETSRLEHVENISSVSGGTLFTGLVLAANEWRWPTSEKFLHSVAPRIKLELTTKNIPLTGALLLFSPTNWRYIFSRANVFSQAFEKGWGIQGTLKNLPPKPIWSINGTTAETGRRFRFKSDRCGDYELGYATSDHFKISEAMAVSAALPGMIGPLAVDTEKFQWMKRPFWGAPPDSEELTILPYARLHIYDGGLYDNLGLEPLFDSGLQRLKSGIDYLVCSDAGSSLKRASPGLPWSPFRALRILNIVMDQTRALRVRALTNFLKNNPESGAYAEIGADPIERIKRFESSNSSAAERLLNSPWLPSDQIKLAAEHPTTLRALSDEQYTRLEQHGYESIRWNEILFERRGYPSP